jgi:hypothetical protein
VIKIKEKTNPIALLKGQVFKKKRGSWQLFAGATSLQKLLSS